MTTRPSDDGTAIEYLTCNECGHDNLVTGWINPQPYDPDEGYLLYNKSTALFDEYDRSGTLKRANVLPHPIIFTAPRHSRDWPGERRKPKRAGGEIWVDDRKRPGRDADRKG